MIAGGTTVIDHEGKVDEWLDREAPPKGPVKYFTPLYFYGRCALVFEGLNAALPQYFATKKGKYWTVVHYGNRAQGLFYWSESARSLFICRNQGEARQLAASLRTRGGTNSVSVRCIGVVDVADYLLNCFNLYIQMVEGGVYPQPSDISVMRIDLD